jgi:hypothetical protein
MPTWQWMYARYFCQRPPTQHDPRFAAIPGTSPANGVVKGL